MDGTTLAPPRTLAGDLLRSAKEIAEFYYQPDPTEQQIRTIYHYAETSSMPIFRMGSMICARRSTLLKWIEDQERRGWPDMPPSFQHGEADRPRRGEPRDQKAPEER